MSFYLSTVKKLVATGDLDPSLPTLVVAGGMKDRQVMLDSGFTDVTISNLDERMLGHEFEPYKWSFLDAENLNVEEGHYAQIIEHMGLHHCASPHRGLLEMYRCAGKSVLVFENRDSLVMRLGVWLGFVPIYEFEAVVGNEYRYGGWRNTAIPNAVYRWTEREVMKSLASYDPAHEFPVRFFYGLRLPHERIRMIRNPMVRAAFKVSLFPFSLFADLFPTQMNEFGFFIDKGRRTPQPWMDTDANALTRSYWGTGRWKDPAGS